MKTVKSLFWAALRRVFAGCNVLCASILIVSAEAAPVSEAEILLKILVEKGLITSEEAEDVRSEFARVREGAAVVQPPPASPKVADDGANDALIPGSPDDARSPETAQARTTPARIVFGSWTERITIFGDTQIRFEAIRGRDDLSGLADRIQRERWRYRLRFGLGVDLADNMSLGLRVETGSSGRGSHVTFADESSVWGKGSDGIHVGRAFITWSPGAAFQTTIGRQKNPFTMTSLTWDGDLNPEGISESGTIAFDDWELFFALGQFLYDDANPDDPFGGAPDFSDAFLFVNQIGARVALGRGMTFQVAPILHVYSGQGDGYRGPFIGTDGSNSTATNDLLILGVPMELRFPVFGMPARFYGDYAINLKGRDRAFAAGHPEEDDAVHAWLLGLEVGSTKKKGDWKSRVSYQATDLYSLDPNLVDSTLFDSRLNMRGIMIEGSYALTDFATISVIFADAVRENSRLPTTANGDLGGQFGTAHLTDFRLIQTNLTVQF